MITKQELLLAHGAKVLLRCEPIDPRSLFSGDYVILNYEISRIGKDIILNSDLKDIEKINHLERKDIYVALMQADDKHYRIAAVSDSFDKLKLKFSTIIRGRVYYADYDELRVRYGVESYFVPQREGRKIEDNMRNVTVEVSVSGNGDSVISKLFIEGEEVKFY
jgi:uncharacterized membrane-anchored protein